MQKIKQMKDAPPPPANGIIVTANQEPSKPTQ